MSSACRPHALATSTVRPAGPAAEESISSLVAARPVRQCATSNRVTGRNAGDPAKTPSKSACGPKPNALNTPYPLTKTSLVIRSSPPVFG